MAGSQPIEIFAQIGASNLTPRALAWSRTLTPLEFEARLVSADLVVGHAGVGTILQARAAGKRLIIFPRRAALGEHRNDHQVAMTQGLSDIPGVRVANTREQLEDLVRSPNFDPPARDSRSPEHSKLIDRLAALTAGRPKALRR